MLSPTVPSTVDTKSSLREFSMLPRFPPKFRDTPGTLAEGSLNESTNSIDSFRYTLQALGTLGTLAESRESSQREH